MNLVFTSTLTQGLQSLGAFFWLSLSSLYYAFFSRLSRRTVFSLTTQTVLECIAPVACVALPIGAMFAFQAFRLAHTFDIAALLPAQIARIVVGDVGPVFGSLVIAMQASSSVAADISFMRRTEQIDALNVMGIEARQFVHGPRLLAIMATTCILNVVSILVALVGAYMVTVGIFRESSYHFIRHLFSDLAYSAIGISCFKSLIFGLLIGGFALFFGDNNRTRRSIENASHGAIVGSVMAIFLSNYVVSSFFI